MTGEVECDDTEDDSEESDDSQRCERFAEIQDTDGGDQGGSNAAPDGIGHADINFLQCQWQQREADGVEHPHEDGWEGFRKASG